MKAGQLRQRVDIQAPTETADAHGQAVVSFAAEATRWAKVEPIGGRELFYAASVTPETTHRVTMRYYETLTPKKRLVFGTRILNILAVRHTEERKEETVCDCVEVLT